MYEIAKDNTFIMSYYVKNTQEALKWVMNEVA